MSLAVNDWAHVDPAVHALADAMARWGARGPAGVAVRSIPCAILLSAEGR